MWGDLTSLWRSRCRLVSKGLLGQRRVYAEQEVVGRGSVEWFAASILIRLPGGVDYLSLGAGDLFSEGTFQWGRTFQRDLPSSPPQRRDWHSPLGAGTGVLLARGSRRVCHTFLRLRLAACGLSIQGGLLNVNPSAAQLSPARGIRDLKSSHAASALRPQCSQQGIPPPLNQNTETRSLPRVWQVPVLCITTRSPSFACENVQ